jgi:hypothetical protein
MLEVDVGDDLCTLVVLPKHYNTLLLHGQQKFRELLETRLLHVQFQMRRTAGKGGREEGRLNIITVQNR